MDEINEESDLLFRPGSPPSHRSFPSPPSPVLPQHQLQLQQPDPLPKDLVINGPLTKLPPPHDH